MDANVERECSALGGLFQQIITDMKNGAPLWEDLISKATKLHSCLRAAILAISAYLEAFQKIADAATNARGATREIGTALTRICLRHKAVETRMKSFTSAIMDCLVLPLQEKLEDWKKSLINLDKEHAKEYKRARTELKKKSSDTLRLQKKKTRKGLQAQGQYGTLPIGSSQNNPINATDDAELGRLLESSVAIVHEKRLSLEETERKAVRAALLEERGRFCQLARFLKPVLDEEIAMLMELTHLEEVADQLQRHAESPQQLPPASEQVIADIKGRDAAQWSLATPPSSPSLSLGSRKSSMCSISSLTSSSSGSCKSHPSPSGHPAASMWHRSLSQQPLGMLVTLRNRRLTNGSSRDSGFTSLQDTMYMAPMMYRPKMSNATSQINNQNARPTATSTWPDLQQETASVQFDTQDQTAVSERPHTISSAYEKGHQRPALSAYTFQAPDRTTTSQGSSVVTSTTSSSNILPSVAKVQLRKNSGMNQLNKPPIPNRCSSLERTSIASKVEADSSQPRQNQRPDSPRLKAKLPFPAHLAKEIHQPSLFQQPMYVNMHELANLAASRAQEMQLPLPPPPIVTSSANVNEDRTASDVATNNEYSQQPFAETSNSGLIGLQPSILQRRASLQQASRPSLPVRRVSAVVGENYDDRLSGGCDDPESLPPPPAFLLEGSPPPTSSLTGSPASQRRSISVSETVRTLTELRHTPASPSLLRRKIAAQVQAHFGSPQTGPSAAMLQITRSTIDRTSSGQSSGDLGSAASSDSRSAEASGPGGVAQSFMAVLSAKLINTNMGSSSGGSSRANSPKPSRKQTGDQANRNAKTSTEFLETLNAKLAQQQQQQSHQSSTSRSASIRRIMGSRVPIMDPLQVRDSLMDQIRRGTSLRKTTGPINDRSAPKIY